ncbi:hypothetical protein M569_15867 [Genlisea aurea]|uniref:Trichome birefringence-like N-terminal domain-containing protein n=1 Tax=Genlisea aurea TaxID=192259 RepID=S8DHV8_9LAMI|nr:hypothetical protein M569_15867 [Genlisea aurea]
MGVLPFSHRCKNLRRIAEDDGGSGSREMIGAVQLGLLAACVVLFVPLVMAGWHLSRNKILFFSGALFITLAVGVHLMPYLSPPEDLIPRKIAAPFPDSSCIRSLHRVEFADAWRRDECSEIRCTKKSWNWIDSDDEVLRCEFQKLTKSDASDLLNGSWIVLAGDSQARLVALSLLNLVLGSNQVEAIREDLFKRHSDYSIMANEIGLKLDFIWAPYAANLSDYTSKLNHQDVNSSPDVIAMGAGLWDMLHINNATEYAISLKLLRDSLISLSTSRSLHHLFWIGMPKLINAKLTTPEKKRMMTAGMWDLYQNQVAGTKILKQSGGPLLNLDIHLLSSLCGEDGTVDGIHYDDSVYDAAVHVMMNALLIQSNQKPRRRSR